jgi:hypothetical protein
MYVRRLTYVPQLGKERELRTLLRERMEARQAVGRRAALYEQAVPPEGTKFVVEDVYEELNQLGAWRQQMRVDEGVADFQAKLATLLLRAPSVELFEVLVPFPAQP